MIYLPQCRRFFFSESDDRNRISVSGNATFCLDFKAVSKKNRQTVIQSLNCHQQVPGSNFGRSHGTNLWFLLTRNARSGLQPYCVVVVEICSLQRVYCISSINPLPDYSGTVNTGSNDFKKPVTLSNLSVLTFDEVICKQTLFSLLEFVPFKGVAAST